MTKVAPGGVISVSGKDRKKKQGKRKGENPEEIGAAGPPMLDPRAMEKMFADINHLLGQREFESVEEMNAFLQKALASEEGIPPAPPPETPLEKAQELVYEALETTNQRKRLQLARKALKVSKDCADAYVLLAEETAKNLDEAIELYEQGVEAGERALGPEAFEEGEGHFWGILETRPYMRARHGLAFCLWEAGEREKAIEHYTEMLRLNPGDNQGIRYLLAGHLLEEGSDEALGELLRRYEDDIAASWVYTRTLWTFRKEGASKEAAAALEEALEANPFVPLYLLGQKRLPTVPPELIGLGDEREAVSYAMEDLTVWLKTPGALEWLREHAPESPGE